eukprot:TRINITY_DN11920_c1_g4_i1.p1 TRINITY_DN11920_c1_g4~~TRINITY_DN11920_c1_g4_i1.p1  ORF type:complete len:342 (+),score=147.00 TRINITY_DN11920_c1_g4_i1:61-1086(+)
MDSNLELSACEWQQIRGAFTQVMREKFWITTAYELQSVCAQLGLDPSLSDMQDYVDDNQPNFDFMTLLRYVEQQKRAFFTPEHKGMATMEAFMAVGGKDVMETGKLDGTATINYAELRDTCHQFNLSLDDSVGDEPSDDTICYDIFAQMFPDEAPVKQPKKLNLGHDYDTLLREEQEREAMRKHSQLCRRKSRKSMANFQRATRNSGAMAQSVGGDHPLAPVKQIPVQPGAANNIAQHDDEQDLNSTVERKKKKKAKRKQRENGLGTTRAWGRSGVYVDDAPKDGSFLPSIARQTARVPVQSGPESPILARIDARVSAMGKRPTYTTFKGAADTRTPTSVY